MSDDLSKHGSDDSEDESDVQSLPIYYGTI